MNNSHQTKIRIYYADTDCGGVVYNSNYLKYFEIGRTEMLRSKGIVLSDFHAKGIIFIVAKVEINFKFPAVYNDELTINSKISDFNKKIFTVYNEIFNQNNKLIVKGFTKCACVNTDKKLISIPNNIFNILNELKH
jgi:acyl-CoA thioester hydrolase